MVWLIVKTLIFGNAVSGYPTIVTVILFKIPQIRKLLTEAGAEE